MDNVSKPAGFKSTPEWTGIQIGCDRLFTFLTPESQWLCGNDLRLCTLRNWAAGGVCRPASADLCGNDDPFCESLSARWDRKFGGSKVQPEPPVNPYQTHAIWIFRLVFSYRWLWKPLSFLPPLVNICNCAFYGKTFSSPRHWDTKNNFNQRFPFVSLCLCGNFFPVYPD